MALYHNFYVSHSMQYTVTLLYIDGYIENLPLFYLIRV